MYQKLKYFLKDDGLFYTALILLIAGASFGLGRYSVAENKPQMQAQAISIEKSKIIPEVAPVETTLVQLVASKNGTKYHLLTCPGASQIKEENKVYFSSAEEARAQGFTPAANCVGI